MSQFGEEMNGNGGLIGLIGDDDYEEAHATYLDLRSHLDGTPRLAYQTLDGLALLVGERIATSDSDAVWDRFMDGLTRSHKRAKALRLVGDDFQCGV